MPHINNKQKLSGFGIIEVLISAFMIATMLGAAVIIANTGVQKTNYAQAKLIATNLANQAVEEIIFARNRAYLDTDATTGFNCPYSATGCSVGLPPGLGEGLYYKLSAEFLDTNANPYFPAVLQPTSQYEPQTIYYIINQDGSSKISYSYSNQASIIFYRTIVIKDILQSEATDVGFNVQFNADPNLIVAKKIHVTVSWVESDLTAKKNAGINISNTAVDQTIILTDWKYGN